MKIIDKFLIKAFIPPFIVAFGIALFVLVLQFLWVYIDDIMGKGLNLFDTAELIFYLSMTLVPMALPIGVLISSVMVMGNLAERYELSSMKSAGVGLLRILRSLTFAVTLITIFSVITSDRIIPWANLQFHSRFYDIRKSKPTLTLQEGVFNDEFRDYTMRIGKKMSDGKSLENVMIYGNKDNNANLMNQITAKRGEMYTTEDKQFIVMNLNDGTQYQETRENNQVNKHYPFVRLKFGSWRKIFDLSQFERQKTDQDLFKKHQKMLSSKELLNSMDSVRKQQGGYMEDMRRTMLEYFSPYRSQAFTGAAVPAAQIATAPTGDSLSAKKFDSLQNVVVVEAPQKPALKSAKTKKKSPNLEKLKDSVTTNSALTLEGTPFKPANVVVKKDTPLSKIHVDSNFYVIEQNLESPERSRMRSDAETKARNVVSQVETTIRNIKLLEETRGKYIYELNLKYTYGVICLVFLFIGAPMGAIVQKGGFGYPILIAIIFFMIFVVANIFGKNLKDNATISPLMAAWMPVLIMLPIATFLTYRATNDYKMLNIDFQKTFNTLVSRFKKKKTAAA